MSLAPIILFVYNRLDHTKRTIELLSKNFLANESELYIFSEAEKSENDREAVDLVRDYLESVKGFKGIIINKNETHLGLANSVISGTTEILRKHKKAIILEDDLLTAPDFLKFMNNALIYYENNFKIFSISGYTFPINIPSDYKNNFYIFPRASSWGWATWLNRWEKSDWNINDFKTFKFDKNEKKKFNEGGGDLTSMLMSQKYGYIDSWAIRWTYAHFKNNAFSLYPTKTRVKNIGFDNTGTHKINTKKFENNIIDSKNDVEFSNDLYINKEIFSEINEILKPSLIRKTINYLKFYILHR